MTSYYRSPLLKKLSEIEESQSGKFIVKLFYHNPSHSVSRVMAMVQSWRYLNAPLAIRLSPLPLHEAYCKSFFHSQRPA